jgi:hypothetical protein
MQRYIGQREFDQFRDTEGACETEMKHRAVTDAEPGGHIGSVENRSDLAHREMSDEGLVMAFLRNRVDLARLRQSGWDFELDVAHERLDGRQPRITGGRAIAALLLEMREEIEHQCGIELLEADLRRRRA